MASAVSQQVLQGIGNDLVNEMVKELGTHVNTGFLRNAITYEITADGNINILMPEYWKYVEYGCFFDNNTLLNTPKGLISIKDLKINDILITELGIKKVIQKEILEIGYPIKKVIITTESGNKLEITEDHPIKTQRGWLKAKDLLYTDEVFIYDN